MKPNTKLYINIKRGKVNNTGGAKLVWKEGSLVLSRSEINFNRDSKLHHQLKTGELVFMKFVVRKSSSKN